MSVCMHIYIYACVGVPFGLAGALLPCAHMNELFDRDNKELTSLSLTLSYSLSLSLLLSLSLSDYIYISYTPSLTLPFSLSLSLTLSMSISIDILYIFLSNDLSISLSPFLPIHCLLEHLCISVPLLCIFQLIVRHYVNICASLYLS